MVFLIEVLDRWKFVTFDLRFFKVWDREYKSNVYNRARDPFTCSWIEMSDGIRPGGQRVQVGGRPVRSWWVL